MHVPITIAALALVTLAAVLFRAFWFRLPRRLRRLLVYAALAMLLLHAAFAVSSWSTTSDRTNVLLNWGAVAGYELIIVLFTLNRPRWLTTISAIILLIPVFASTILMPLAGVFDSVTPDVRAMGDGYFFERRAWDADVAVQNSGVDLVVYYRPRFAPFMRHKVQRAAFNNEQCDATASFASVEPDRKSLRFHCPALPSQPQAGNIELVLPIH